MAGQRSALIDRRVVEYDPEIEIGVRSVGAFDNRSGELRRDGSDHSLRGSHYRVDTVGGDVAQVGWVATFYRPGVEQFEIAFVDECRVIVRQETDDLEEVVGTSQGDRSLDECGLDCLFRREMCVQSGRSRR